MNKLINKLTSAKARVNFAIASVGIGIMNTPMFSAAGGLNGINTNVSTGTIVKNVLMIIGGVVALIAMFILIPGIVKYILAHRSANGDEQATAAKDIGVGAALFGVGVALAAGSGPIISLFGL